MQVNKTLHDCGSKFLIKKILEGKLCNMSGDFLPRFSDLVPNSCDR